MTADYGNVPRLVLYSNVVNLTTPSFYRSNGSSTVLTLITDDGRDDHVKLCNGIGKYYFLFIGITY